MALLTADEVHWKQFQATKFREGYDQDEVDQFLDEVVETIAALQEENDTLKGQLDQARTAAAEGQPFPIPADGEAAQLKAELEAAQERINALQQENEATAAQVAQLKSAQGEGANAGALAQVSQLQDALSQAQAEASQAHEQAEAARQEAGQLAQKVQELEEKAASPVDESKDATSMLSLAQRVHDEYVRNGQEEANQIVADSRAQGEQIIREANDQRQQILDQLAGEQSQLEQKVNELRSFESDYRSKIADHLRGLLDQVNTGEEH